VSVNEEVVHGMPRKDKYLKEGDIVSFDLEPFLTVIMGMPL
jgi:methionine aminopeptidase, type I (EC 3.4.11.18)